MRKPLKSAQGPLVRTCALTPTRKGEHVFPYAQRPPSEPCQVNTVVPVTSGCHLKTGCARPNWAKYRCNEHA